MTRILKKVIGMVLSIAMLTSMGSVFAEDVGSGTDYVVTYSAEEITDIDELIDIGINSSATRSATNDNQIEVKQLLETRLYNDGHTEKDYVANGVAVADMDGRQLTRDAIWDSSQNGSAYQFGVAMAANLYFTIHQTGEGFYVVHKVRVNRYTTQISSNANLVSLSKLTYGYHIWNGISDLGKIESTYNPSLHSEYTSYSSNSNYHQITGGNNNRVYGASVLDTSSGSISVEAPTHI